MDYPLGVVLEIILQNYKQVLIPILMDYPLGAFNIAVRDYGAVLIPILMDYPLGVAPL